MRTLRASEIAAYLYCQRAWWYQKSGKIPANQAQMDAGSELHVRHGRAWLVSMGLRGLGYLLLLAAVAAFSIYLADLIL